MKKSRYTETQIVKILKEVEAGRLVKEIWALPQLRGHFNQISLD
ncbi:Uncharacterised protein [Legionella pneumophila]|nr:hypothetical protein [Legionella pneumophila]CZI72230.1 Uncharacterised protein [Legionella pneumophila]